MNITKKDICIGLFVEIIQYDSRNNETVHRGYIKRVITQGKSDKVKVELDNNECGVVVHILTKEELKLEAFKFYNKFLYEKTIYAIWHRYEQSFFVYRNKQEQRDILYVFHSKEQANTFTKKYLDDNYMVKELKKSNKSLQQLFSKTDFNTYYINEERKISKDKLHEFERDLIKKSK